MPLNHLTAGSGSAVGSDLKAPEQAPPARGVTATAAQERAPASGANTSRGSSPMTFQKIQ